MDIRPIYISGREYQVSDQGDVFNPYGKKLMKHLRKGYEYVAISNNNVRKKYSVHRLVCSAFHDNPEDLPQVNHIDGNTQNNKADNLEWISDSGNQTHSRYVLGNETGFKDTPVRCIDTNTVYISTRDAWRKTGVNYCHISECASGKRQTAGGARWEYATLG